MRVFFILFGGVMVPCKLNRRLRMITKPEFASWESTLRCNLRCTHCGLSAGCSRENELDTEESIEMLQRLSDLGVKNLVISGGEFTLRNDWVPITRFALRKFDLVRIISNGRLGAEYVYILEQIPNWERLLISLSLDGTKNVHNDRRGPGSYEKVEEGLSTQSYIPINIVTTVTKENFDDINGVLEICLKHNVTSWSISLGLPAGNMKREDFVGEDKLDLLADFICKCQKENGEELKVFADDCFLYFHPMRRSDPWVGCHGGKRLIAVLSDGSITGCPMWIDKICGNVRSDLLGEVWFGDRMRKLKEVPKYCRECNKCAGGCKAVQYVFGRQFCVGKI